MRKSTYTVAEAARRAGCSEAKIRTWIKKGKVHVIPGSRPKRIEGKFVDDERSKVLRRFDDLADLSAQNIDEQGRVHGQNELVEIRRQLAERDAQLRQVIASQAVLNEGWSEQLGGYQKQLLGQQGLMDAMLASLPSTSLNASAPPDGSSPD